MEPTTIAPPPSASPQLSVVMPAYNEAPNIAAAIAEVVTDVFAVVPDAELLVVDDGSRDDTGAIAESCARNDPRVRVIRQVNAGHGPALVHGMREARGDYLLLLDSDRQIGLERFAETWRLGRERDAVLGVRVARDDPRHRLVLTVALRRALALVLGVRAVDANVPYKLVRREVAQRAVAAMPAQPRIPSILLTVYLARYGHSLVEQPVTHRARRAGETTLKLGRLARFCRAATVELLRFHRSLGPRG